MDSDHDDSSGFLFVPAEPDKEAQERVLNAIANNDGSVSKQSLESQWPITCQVKIDTTGQQGPYWILTSLDSEGNPKTMGGDEYYIAFTADAAPITLSHERSRQPYSAVALWEDRQDGTYVLDFSATPTCPIPPSTDDHGGTLTIFFQYSCGIGIMAPPSKIHWKNGAYTHRRYDICLAKSPPIRAFCPPNSTTLYPQNFSEDYSVTKSCQTIDLSQMDLIVAFGDSTMQQFVRQRPNKKGKYFFQSNITLGEKVLTGLNSNTVTNLLDMLERGSGELLRGSKFPRKVLLLGSCLWDILDSKDTLQGVDYKDHQQALKKYIREIKKRYPHISIIWRSPLAVHIQVVDLERLVVSKIGEAALFGIERIRYMSASRSKALYEIQKQLIQEEGGVMFLDLYKATYLSGDWLFPSDGRHYRPDLNRLMLQWFYKCESNDLLEKLQVIGDNGDGMLLNIPKPYFVDPTYEP